jgi:hypothetical protein
MVRIALGESAGAASFRTAASHSGNSTAMRAATGPPPERGGMTEKSPPDANGTPIELVAGPEEVCKSWT